MDLDKVRKCFKRLETYMILDNYFRSISGLPPCSIFKNVNLVRWHWSKIVPDYLMSLANPEVNPILRTLEKPDMYVDRNPTSSQLIPGTSLTNGTEKGTSTEKENNPSPGFRPITWPASENSVQESSKVTHSQGMALLKTKATTGWTIH